MEGVAEFFPRLSPEMALLASDVKFNLSADVLYCTVAWKSYACLNCWIDIISPAVYSKVNTKFINLMNLDEQKSLNHRIRLDIFSIFFTFIKNIYHKATVVFAYKMF